MYTAHLADVLPPREKAVETNLGCQVITSWKWNDIWQERVEHITLSTPVDTTMAQHRSARARATQ